MARIKLEPRKLYELHTGNENRHGKVLECIRVINNDSYSEYTARIRSTITGWTMTVHGTNVYPDGSIDWDFSTDGFFTDFNDDGCLIRRY